MSAPDKMQRDETAKAPGGQTVRETVYGLLRAFGMTTVFGNPGSTELRFFRDWPRDFRYVLSLQESIAVAMADGYAQATRGCAFVNLHSAAGAGNAMGSIFTAYRNQTPLVITAGQQTRAMFPTEPFLFSAQATDLPRPYVKWSVEPARAQDVPAAIVRAYYVAMQKPRGPVFVSVPEDDWDALAEPVAVRDVSFDVAPDPDALVALVRALDASRRPVIVAGNAVDQDDAWDALVRLAERLEAPVWASPMYGRASFPEDHRLFAGALPPLRRPLAEKLAGHDLVLVLGAPVFVYHVHTGGEFLPSGAALWLMSDDPDAIARAPVGNAVRASMRLGLAQLLEALPARPRARAEGRRLSSPPAGAERPTGAYLMHAVARLRPKDAVIVEEAPTHRDAQKAFLPTTRSGGFYSQASGGLGWGIAAAAGIALAQKDKVICVLGDGSALFSIQALWSAANQKLPIAYVIFNNSGYGALRSFSGLLGVRGAPGHDVKGVDFAHIARGFGCEADTVERTAQLDAALRAAFASDKPYVVDVRLAEGVERLYED